MALKMNNLGQRCKSFFIKAGKKPTLQLNRLKWVFLGGIVAFVAGALFWPTAQQVDFQSTKTVMAAQAANNSAPDKKPHRDSSTPFGGLWAAPHANHRNRVDYDTSMIIDGGGGRSQLEAGQGLVGKLMDDVVISQNEVPIRAELVKSSETQSGQKLPRGTRFFGQANFQAGTDRATIQFQEISYPTGEMKQVSGFAASFNGQAGIPGEVFSDQFKNSAGEFLSNFLGSFAAGSMQTDVFGRSTGGVENGLLNAVSQTAQNRAGQYAEKLKTQREWIRLRAGTHFQIILNQPIKVGGDL